MYQLFNVLEWYIDCRRTEVSDDKRRDTEESREWDSRETDIAAIAHWPCLLGGANGTQSQLAESCPESYLSWVYCWESRCQPSSPGLAFYPTSRTRRGV